MGLLFCLLSHVKFLFALNPPSLPRRYNGHPPPQLGLKKTCPKADLVPVVLVIRNAANFLKELAEVPAAEEGNLVRIATGLRFCVGIYLIYIYLHRLRFCSVLLFLLAVATLATLATCHLYLGFHRLCVLSL